MGVCENAFLGSSVAPKGFLWGHFWVGERGFEGVFWGPLLNSSPMPGRAMFRVAPKERRQRVQLHVGLRAGSPGEFCCTQSLPLGANFDGRNDLHNVYFRVLSMLMFSDCVLSILKFWFGILVLSVLLF